MQILLETISAPLWLLLLVSCGVLWLIFRFGLAVGRRSRVRLSREMSRRALAGRAAEQWAPYLEGFPGAPTEAKFLGAPIDYVVFRGLGTGEVEEVVFVEVKSGASSLSSVERSLRNCIREQRVSWMEHRIDPPE